MLQRYELSATRYICTRCKTTIDVPSDSFYEFSGEMDPNFWCAVCQDFPRAEIVGCPAQNLPRGLQLLKAFEIFSVPRLEPADDNDSANLLYRPYTKRSFLRQYVDWLKIAGFDVPCDFIPAASCFKRFSVESQQYTTEVDYELVDDCSDSPCRFLRTKSLKPVRQDDLNCWVLNYLCDVKAAHALCQTPDEAQILQNYVTLTGDEHFPMLIPQPSILSGRRRPDFLCFVPITKFQYRIVAVLVDRPGKDSTAMQAEKREYEAQGYVVRRILIDRENPDFSYFKTARNLKNWLESADHDTQMGSPDARAW
jgi:hypothetical protein